MRPKLPLVMIIAKGAVAPLLEALHSVIIRFIRVRQLLSLLKTLQTLGASAAGLEA